MNEKVILIDYEEKYANVMNKIEEEQWGSWNNIKDEIGENTEVKLAQVNNEIVGFGYGKRIGDTFYIQVIIVKPKYQHEHIGSMFMEHFINYSKSLGLEKIVFEGVLANGTLNIEGIVKKYGFKELIRIKEYWGYKFPDVLCTECNLKPCKCTNVIFVKEL